MNTPILSFPLIAPAQAQSYVTHNEALRMLDVLVQLSVESEVASPPAEPAEGDCHIVGAPATGAWTGMEGQIAAFQDGGWTFYAPREGWRAWVAGENALWRFDGGAWAATIGEAINCDQIGINATADTTNRLALSSPASLFDHDGAGHQLKINKASSAETAALLLQTAFSGRAEIGTLGSDDLAFKVSPDGSSWLTGFSIDAETGKAAFPQGLLAPLAIADGGTGAVTGLAALGGLGLRHGPYIVNDDAMVEIDFGGAIYGSVIFLVGNTTSVPLGTIFARMASGPQLVPLGIAGGTLGTYTTPLTGTTGTDGQVNIAALDGGKLRIENRRGFAVTYSLYLLR